MKTTRGNESLRPAGRRRWVLVALLAGTGAAAMTAATAAAAEPAPGFGLIAHWSFDADFGSSVHDAVYRAVGRGPEARVGVDRSAGNAKVGPGALRIASARRGGDRGYLALEQPLWGDGGTGVVCVTAWLKASDLGGDGAAATNLIVESFPTLSALGLGVRTEGGRKRATFRVRTTEYRVYSDLATSTASAPAGLRPDHTRIAPDGDATVREGEWAHVALAWNGPAGRLRFYVHGRLEREIAMPPGARLEYTRGLHLGTNRIAGGSDWDGWIDDVAVFDVELTARQVRALAEGTFEGRAVAAANVLAIVPEPATATAGAAGRQYAPPSYPAPEDAMLGPAIGHVEADGAVLWARVPGGGAITANARSGAGPAVRATAEAEARHDWTLRWELRELRPGTEYRVSFTGAAGQAVELAPLTVRVPPPAEQPAAVALGFGSCSDYPDSPVWTRIAEGCPDGMVLLGDTPYIDTTELRWVRWAYRRFASAPQFAAMARRIPFWGTWDDHDFGRNDSDGTLPGKEFSRQGFAEYRPNATVGEDGQGVYTRFRRGPVEVFLLDTRWFAKTGKSWADPKQPTLLGARQWAWLQAGLRASTAPFKVLASGMIWDRKPGAPESDCWGAYSHERDAVWRWLGDNRIEGAVLIGGDIHRSRHVVYPAAAGAGYPLHQFIISPLNDRVIPGRDDPAPRVVHAADEPWVFLRLTADNTAGEPRLRADWINRDGRRLFGSELRAGELRR